MYRNSALLVLHIAWVQETRFSMAIKGFPAATRIRGFGPFPQKHTPVHAQELAFRAHAR